MKLKSAISIGCIFFTIVFYTLNKKPAISKEDFNYINLFLKEWGIQDIPQNVHKSYFSELSFIRKVEEFVICDIHHCLIPQKYFGNIRYYYQTRKGFCYDRAILLEKIFIYFQFDFRHIFIYCNSDKRNAPNVFDFFRKQTQSHALLEVKTKNGWMLLDTNANWIGLDRNDNPVSLKNFQYPNSSQKLNKVIYTFGKPFWQEFPQFRYVYGVYSRGGSLFGPKGLPELNFIMLVYNFW